MKIVVRAVLVAISVTCTKFSAIAHIDGDEGLSLVFIAVSGGCLTAACGLGGDD